MSSNIATFMWYLLPAVRKQKPQSESRLFGLLDSVGAVLDELKSAIMTARLRRYALVCRSSDPYYSSELRSEDLDSHARDRGLWRLPGENDASLLERILTLPYRNRFLGTKSGIKYLLEEIYRLRCDQIVEYYADDLAWIILSGTEQEGEVETNITHVFTQSEGNQFTAFRQTRIYGASDLSHTFHFWVAVSNPNGATYDSEVVTEAINAAKPAHTRAVVHYMPNPNPGV